MISWNYIKRTFAIVAVLAVAAIALNADSGTRQAEAQTVPLSITARTACTLGSVFIEVTPQSPAPGGFRYHQLRLKRATSATWSQWWDLQFVNDSLRTASTDNALWDIQVRQLYRFGLIFSYGSPVSTQARGAQVGCPLNVESYPGNANGTIRTHWDAPSQGTVTGYQYRQKLTSGSWPTTGNMGWTDVTAGNRFVEFSTSSNAKHDIQVRSVNQAGSPPSNVYSIISQDTHSLCCTRSRQNRPTTFSAETGTDPGEVDLSWTGTTAPSLVLWRDTSSTRWDLADRAAGDHGRQAVASGTSTTLTLIPNHSYEFAVQNSTASSGVSGFRTASARTHGVDPPTNLSLAVNSADPGQIDATWRYPTPATTVLDGFEYSARAPGRGWTAWTDATAPATNPKVPGTTWTAAITGVGRVGQTVEVRIRSQITLTPGGGTSTPYYSTPISDTQMLPLPDPPTNVNASQGTNIGDLDVTWTAATATVPSGGSYAGARVRYRRTSTNDWSQWQSVAQGTTTLTVSTGVGNVEYEIQVQTQVDLDGSGPGTALAYSTSASWRGVARAVASPTAPPAGVTAQTTVNCEVRLTWQAPTGLTVQHYRYRYALVPTPPDTPSWSHWHQTADGTALSALLTGLDITGNYQFQIEAVHATQGTSNPLTATQQLQMVTGNVPCAPRDFTAAESNTYGELALTWKAPQHGTVSKYQARFKRATDSYPATGAMGWTDITTSESGGTYSAAVQTTAEGIAWDVEVRAVDTSSSTPVNGSIASANPPVEPRQVPTSSWFQAVSGRTVGSVQLLWGDPSEEGFEPWRYQYRIKQTTASWGDSGTEWTLVTGGRDARSLRVTGLNAASNYDIELRSAVLISSTERAYSPASDHQAEAAAHPPVDNFRATPHTTPGSVRITWDEPAGTINLRNLRVRTSTSDPWSNEIILTSGSPQTIILDPGQSWYLGITVVTATGRTGFSALSRTVTPAPVKTPRDVETESSTSTYGAADLTFRIPSGTNQYEGFQYRAKRQDQEWDNPSATDWQDTTAPVSGRVTQTVTDAAGASGVTLDVEVRTKISLQPANADAASDFYSTALSTTAMLTPAPDPTRVFARPGLLVGDLELSWRHASIRFTGYTRTGTRILWKHRNEEEYGTIDLVGPGANGASARSYFFTLRRGWEPYDIIVQTIVESNGVTTYSAGVERSAYTKANPGPTFPIFGESAMRTDNPGEVILYWVSPEGEDFDTIRIRHAEVTGGIDPVWKDDWLSFSRTATTARISGLHLGPDPVAHRFQIQAYDFSLGGSIPIEIDVDFPALPAPHDFTVYMSQGTATLGWNEPTQGTAHGHRYRWRKTDDPDRPSYWTEWVVEDIVNNDPLRIERYSHEIQGLEAETSYTFELQAVYNQDSFSRSVFRMASTLVALPILSKIEPQARTVTVPASSELRLAVDVYDQQGDVANSAADNRRSLYAGYTFEYIWNDAGAGGSVNTLGDGRIAIYTVPSNPGTYTVTVELGPAGVCDGHHEAPPDFNECRATITIRVIRPQQTVVTAAIPVNPTGLIPTSITDSTGNAYEVFTPADGGRFDSGDGMTVTAEPGAVPNGTLVGIRAESLPATGSYAGFSSALFTFSDRQIRLTAADVQGEQLSDLRLTDPLQLCTPLPAEMRSRLDVVTLIQMPAAEEDDITLLSSRVYRLGNDLSICGAVSQLPATVAIARMGAPPTATPTTGPAIGNIDTGAKTAPAWPLLALALLMLATAATVALRRVRV